jgi:hypothetical protein
MLSSLRLVLYETRSRSVNPSCVVTMFTEADGRLRAGPYRSGEPAIRVPRSASMPSLPRQNDRTVSRNFPFHSLQPGGKRPTSYESGCATSHGSAISFTWDTIGSWCTASKKSDRRVKVPSCRASVGARSNR